MPANRSLPARQKASRTSTFKAWAPWLPPRTENRNVCGRGISVFVGGKVDYSPANRISRQNAFMPGKETTAVRERQAYPVDDGRQFSVGKPGNRVLLVNDGRDAHRPSSCHHRSRHIPSDAEDNIRLESVNMPQSLEKGERQDKHRLQQFNGILALDAVAEDTAAGETVIRETDRIHFPFRPDKEHLRLRIIGTESLGGGNRRKEMAAGATSGQQ